MLDFFPIEGELRSNHALFNFRLSYIFGCIHIGRALFLDAMMVLPYHSSPTRSFPPRSPFAFLPKTYTRRLKIYYSSTCRNFESVCISSLLCCLSSKRVGVRCATKQANNRAAVRAFLTVLVVCWHFVCLDYAFLSHAFLSRLSSVPAFCHPPPLTHRIPHARRPLFDTP